MPVALRKRSWEDHVTPHWGTRYSYDDLDLICWHGVVDGGGPSTGPRERCASMPECRRRRPAVGSRTEAGDRAEASGTEPIPEESVVIRAQGSPETKLTKLGDSEDDHVGGPVDAAGADADLTGEDRSSEHLDPSQVSKTSVAPDVSFPNPAAQSSGVACHSRNVDRLDAGGPLAKTRDFGASSDHESSREEREMARCRLDSMVLLIMKLDQLDQEIESALSSAPSHDGTPTLKRRIISVSSQSTSRDDPSGSAHSLNTHHHH
uniref:Uncharacterized protein n=1 Tax=Electrophorus electricus TaxID=8005 RepID=A0A4W4G509_ELEEL